MDEDLAPGVGAGVGVVVLDGVSEKSSAKLLSMFGQLQNCKGKYILHACLCWTTIMYVYGQRKVGSAWSIFLIRRPKEHKWPHFVKISCLLVRQLSYS